MKMKKRSPADAAALAARLVCREGLSREEARTAACGETGVRVPAGHLEAEIRRWMRLFEPAALEERLARRRRIALEVMRRLPALGLRLTGPVLAGSATAEDPAELFTDGVGVKAALLALLDAGFEPEASGEEGVLAVRLGEEPVVIRILRPQERPLRRMPPSGGAVGHPLEARDAVDAEALERLLLETARPS